MDIQAVKTYGRELCKVTLIIHRADSLIRILQEQNHTLMYAYEPLESLLIYQAIPGERRLQQD
jgi:hypothetical protein